MLPNSFLNFCSAFQSFAKITEKLIYVWAMKVTQIYIMIDQAQEQLRVNEQFFQEKEGAIKINLPKQSQSQIQRIVNQSNSMLRNFADKQLLSEKLGSVHYKNMAKMRMAPFEILDEKDRKITKEQILSMSILPIFGKILLRHFQNLAQIQFEINPITRKLIQVPQGTQTVMQFVSKFAVTKTLWDKFNLIDAQFRGQFDQQNRINLWRPLFQFVYNCLSKLSFKISPSLFEQIVWNRYLPQPLTEDKFQFERQKIIRQELQEIQVEYHSKKDAYQDRISQMMIQRLLKNREKLNEPNHTFFSIIKNVNQYDQIIQTASEAQADALLAFSQEARNRILEQERLYLRAKERTQAINKVRKDFDNALLKQQQSQI